MTTTQRSTALDFAGSIEAAAQIVTEGTAMFTSEDLAGQYAFDGAKDNDDLSLQGFEAQLECLADAGAVFDQRGALAVAQNFLAAAVGTRFAIIESNSGYVWGVVNAADAQAACLACDEEIGGRPEAGTYEAVSASELKTTRGVYDVRLAPAGFEVQDGQDKASISAVEAMPRAGIFGWVAAS